MQVVNWWGHGQQIIPWPEADGERTLVPLIGETTSHERVHRKGERRMPYSNVTPEGLRETILHLLRNDDEVKQAILDLIRREGEKHPRRGDR
jgi:hypothetical protein